MTSPTPLQAIHARRSPEFLHIMRSLAVPAVSAPALEDAVHGRLFLEIDRCSEVAIECFASFAISPNSPALAPAPVPARGGAALSVVCRTIGASQPLKSR
jgi:hypothetical protein